MFQGLLLPKIGIEQKNVQIGFLLNHLSSDSLSGMGIILYLEHIKPDSGSVTLVL